MWGKSPGFLSFVLNRLMSKEEYLRTAINSLVCDVEVAFSRMPRKTGRGLSSFSARVSFIAGTGGRRESAAVA